MGRIGLGELLIILLIALLIFGAKRLPELAKSLGRAVSGFKKGLKDVTDDIPLDTNTEDTEKKEEDK